MKKMNLENAIEILKKHLKEDEDYFFGWQANIASCIYDTFKEEFKIISKQKIFNLANKSAKRFLKNLIEYY